MKRLRFVLTTAPRVNPRFKRAPDIAVSFAPMDALADGLGGLSELETKAFSEVASGSYNYFENGDVLLAKVTPCFENGKKAIARDLQNGAGFATSEVLVFRPDSDGIDTRYLRYLFCAEDFRHRAIASMTGAGGLRRVSERAVMDFPLRITDLPTQRAIADFLDRETARIDLLIEKKKRLVALLGERKTVELEKLLFESGFHIRKLRREARVISKGTTPSTIGAEMVDDGVRFLKAENVTWNGVSTSPENFISEETHRELKRSSLQPSDVLVVIAGATTGKTAVMPAELAPANTNQAVSFVRLREPRYAEIVCAAIGCPRIQRDILLTSVQSAQPNLSMEDLGNLMLPFPDEADISTVFEKVTATNSRTTTLISATETSIDRLKEYRSALITAAVTGQVDLSTYSKSGATDRRLDAIQEEIGA